MLVAIKKSHSLLYEYLSGADCVKSNSYRRCKVCGECDNNMISFQGHSCQQIKDYIGVMVIQDVFYRSLVGFAKEMQ